MKMTWVVVADSVSARVLQWENDALRLLETWEHLPSREHNQDLMGNRPNMNQHSMETTLKGDNPANLREGESLTFAREVANNLHKAHAINRFAQLILVADPKFLGLLRAALTKSVERTVIDSFDKRANDKSEEEIAELVGDHLSS